MRTIAALWRALHKPRCAQHPVARWAASQPSSRRLRGTLLFAVSVLAAMLLVCVASFVVPTQMLTPFGLLPLLVPPVVLVLSMGGTGFGLDWSMTIARRLAQLRGRGLDALLGVAPGGRLGTCAALAAGVMHQGQSLPRTLDLVHRLVTCAALGGSLVVLALALNAWTSEAALWVGRLPAWLGRGLLMYYVDFLAAVLLAPMVGVLAGLSSVQQGIARALAAVGFLAAQLLGWVVWLAISGWLPPILPGAASLAVAALHGLVFLAVKAAMVGVAWRMVTAGLGARPKERAALLDGPE